MAIAIPEFVGQKVIPFGTRDTTVDHAVDITTECANRAWTDGNRPVILYTVGGLVQICTLDSHNLSSATESHNLVDLRDQTIAAQVLRRRATILGISPAALAKLVNEHAPHG